MALRVASNSLANSSDAAELAASAAQLRHLMQQLLANRSKSKQQAASLQPPGRQLQPQVTASNASAAEDAGTKQQPLQKAATQAAEQGNIWSGAGTSNCSRSAEADAPAVESSSDNVHGADASSAAAGVNADSDGPDPAAGEALQVKLCPAAPAARGMVPCDTELPASPQSTPLALHARRLLSEMEHAAAGSPVSMAAAQLFPSADSLVQKLAAPAYAATAPAPARASAVTVQPMQSTFAVRSVSKPIEGHAAAAAVGPTANHQQALAASVDSNGVSDSMAWSAALQQYRLHQIQIAGLRGSSPQEANIAHMQAGDAARSPQLYQTAGSTAAGLVSSGSLLDSCVKLEMRSLRGPLEDAMRCCMDLQVVQQDAERLHCHNTHLMQAAEQLQAERAYLLAERKLVTAQLRQLEAVATSESSDGSSPGHGSCSACALQEAVLQDIVHAQTDLKAALQQVPSGSSLRATSECYQLACKCSSLTAQLEHVLASKRQQLQGLQGVVQERDTRLQQCQQQRICLQQQCNELQQQMAANGKAAEALLQKVVGQLEAKWGKKLLKHEQKIAGMAQEHQRVLNGLQQQLQQQADQLTDAAQRAQRRQTEFENLQLQLHLLELECKRLQQRLDTELTARNAADSQVQVLQSEQQQLLAAVHALEESLLESKQAISDKEQLLHDKDQLCQRLEESVEQKATALVEAKRAAKEGRAAAQQACDEVQQLQQQLGSLKPRFADTSRQLSAARNAAREQAEQLQQEQQRRVRQAAAVEELQADLEEMRRSLVASQKAQAEEAKQAATAEQAALAARSQAAAAQAAAEGAEATAAELRDQAQEAQSAAADAARGLAAAEQLLQQGQEQKAALHAHCKALQQQIEGYNKALVQCQMVLKAAEKRAAVSESEVSDIRQDIAEWVLIRSNENSELQQTRRKLAEAETDLGVAMQRVAVYGRSRPCSPTKQQQQAAPQPRSSSMPGSTCKRRPASSVLDHMTAKGLGGENSRGDQQLPLDVTRQLQWQAKEVIRLQGELTKLQAQLMDKQQQLVTTRQQLQTTQQQLQAAETAFAWHQKQQQQQAASPSQQPAEKGRQQHRQLQQLQQALSEAHVRTAELTLELSLAKTDLAADRSTNQLEVMQLKEQLAVAEAAVMAAERVQQWEPVVTGQAQYLLEKLQCKHQQQQRRQQQQRQQQHVYQDSRPGSGGVYIAADSMRSSPSSASSFSAGSKCIDSTKPRQQQQQQHFASNSGCEAGKFSTGQFSEAAAAVVAAAIAQQQDKLQLASPASSDRLSASRQQWQKQDAACAPRQSTTCSISLQHDGRGCDMFVDDASGSSSRHQQSSHGRQHQNGQEGQQQQLLGAAGPSYGCHATSGDQLEAASSSCDVEGAMVAAAAALEAAATA